MLSIKGVDNVINLLKDIDKNKEKTYRHCSQEEYDFGEVLEICNLYA
jgi:hypothetical protein